MIRLPATSLFLLLSLSAVACGGEDFTITDPSAPGAGGSEDPRSESSSGGPSSPSQDPSANGGPAAAAPVVVSVLGVDGLPEANVGVVFHDANGAVIGEAKTGADGKASSAGFATPSMASALLGDAKTKHVLTWTTVKAGDVLETKNISWGEPIGSYAVNMPAAMPGVSHYRGYVSDCVGFGAKAATSFGLEVKPECARAGNGNSVLVIAYGDLVTPIGYAYAKDVAVPLDTKLEVPTNAFAPIDALDVVISNIPDKLAAETEVFNVANGVAVVGGYTPLKGEKGTFPVAAAFADSFQIHASAWNGNDTADGWHTVSKRVASTTTEASVDFGGALPAITGRLIDQSEPARPTLSWASTGSLAATDGGHISFVWYPNDTDMRGWTLLVAPNATSVKVPALPASAATYVPPAKQVNGPHILFVESDAFADHDAFRRTAGRVMPLGTELGYGFTVRHTMLPSAGMTLRGTER